MLCQKIYKDTIVDMFEDFNIKLGIFIIAAIIIVGYGTYVIYGYYKGLGALLYFVGSLYVCIIYGTRWFGPTKPVTSWPPIINTCPDYLSYYKRTTSDGNMHDTCIDTFGIADPTVLQKFPADGMINPPQDDSHYFSLETTATDKKSAMCSQAIGAKLTWEGITNGESCVFPTPQ